jgi:hypothetical protein
MDDRGMSPSPLANRIGVGAVLLLLAAFALGTMWALMAPAGADAQLAGKRDDDVREVAFIDDDDDDDDDRMGKATHGTGSNDSRNSGTGNSGSRSIGSHSANTRTGTTRGTGVSRSVSNSSDRSANTRTGTTRGTGPSRSVSNSS